MENHTSFERSEPYKMSMISLYVSVEGTTQPFLNHFCSRKGQFSSMNCHKMCGYVTIRKGSGDITIPYFVNKVSSQTTWVPVNSSSATNDHLLSSWHDELMQNHSISGKSSGTMHRFTLLYHIQTWSGLVRQKFVRELIFWGSSFWSGERITGHKLVYLHQNIENHASIPYQKRKRSVAPFTNMV